MHAELSSQNAFASQNKVTQLKVSCDPKHRHHNLPGDVWSLVAPILQHAPPTLTPASFLCFHRVLSDSSSEVPIKQCPMCGIYIERNQGCAQMLCKSCKHTFCWYCLQSLDVSLPPATQLTDMMHGFEHKLKNKSTALPSNCL